MSYTPNMGSPAYWRERALDRDAAAKLSEDELIAQVNRLYSQAFREIKREINDWYNTYATENGLTHQEAQRVLTPIQMQQYQNHIATLRRLYNASHNPYLLNEINRLSSRAYLTQQMALMDAIDEILIETAHNVQISLEDHLINMYQREYQNTLESLGMAGTAVTPVNAIKEIIQYPYAGAMFSDRIWRNKNQLLNYINNDLSKHLIKGSSVQRMSKELMNRCHSLYYQAARLIRTETNYAITQGTLNAYTDSGVVQQYEFLAAIDHRTSPQCRDKNGQVFELTAANVGNNLPPLHPNCRSTIIPVINRNYLEKIKEKDNPSKDNNIEKLEFKNKKEATDYVIKNLGFYNVNWGRKLTQEMINDTVDTMDKIFKMYPALKGSMKELYTDSSMGRAIAAVSYYGDLKISPSLFTKQNKDKRIHTIAHECSHMLERITDWNKYAPKVVNKAFSNLKYDKEQASKAVRSISKYATTNHAECMAEAFADVFTRGNDATELSKEIVSVINSTIDKEMKK